MFLAGLQTSEQYKPLAKWTREQLRAYADSLSREMVSCDKSNGTAFVDQEKKGKMLRKWDWKVRKKAEASQLW